MLHPTWQNHFNLFIHVQMTTSAKEKVSSSVASWSECGWADTVSMDPFREIAGLQKAADTGCSPASTVFHWDFCWAVTHPSAFGTSRHFYTDTELRTEQAGTCNIRAERPQKEQHRGVFGVSLNSQPWSVVWDKRLSSSHTDPLRFTGFMKTTQHNSSQFSGSEFSPLLHRRN